MRSLLVGAVILLGWTATSQAQQAAFYWDELEGGFVDVETGLVWSFGPSHVLGWAGYTYAGAIESAADDYAATIWGFPFTDWRLPTKSEMLDAAAKGIWLELNLKAAEVGLRPLDGGGHWAADAPFKQQGKWYGYAVDLDTVRVHYGSVGWPLHDPRLGQSVYRVTVIREAVLP